MYQYILGSTLDAFCLDVPDACVEQLQPCIMLEMPKMYDTQNFLIHTVHVGMNDSGANSWVCTFSRSQTCSTTTKLPVHA